MCIIYIQKVFIYEVYYVRRKKILSEQFNGLTETLQKVITFKTEKGIPAPGAPFGTEVKTA